MKTIKYITPIMLISLLISAVSCSDALNEQEGFTLAGDTDYNNSENMILPMLGAYHIIYTRGWEDFPLISVRGDDVNAGGLGDQQAYADTDNFSYNKDYWMYNSLWENMNKDMISINDNMNQIQIYVDNASNNNAISKANQYFAECKVLRAWLQFQVTRVWGPQFIISSSNANENILAGVKSKDEIMKYISDLMDEAIPYLPDMRPNQRTDIAGGITKYTALAIKALANLEMKNYPAVAEASGQIIASGKFSLMSDYYELFKKPGKLSDENLLEFQYSDYNTASGPSFDYLWAFFGPQKWIPAVDGVGGGWGFYEPSMKYIKFMLKRGETKRLQTSVLFTNRGIDEIKKDPAFATLPTWISNTTPDGDFIDDYDRAMFASGKHYLPSNQITTGRTSYGSGKNMICIRYAEILLMYAEAVLQGGKASAMSADQAVNLVRQRAGLANLTGVTLNQVMDEKFAELAMEWGTRYYDMIRMENYTELSYDGRTFSADKAYLPYPQAQVDVLPLDTN